MFPKIPHLDNQLFFTILTAALVFILILWYDSSSISYNSYNTICTSNYGKVTEYNDCMKPFYNQLNMDIVGMWGAGIVIFVTILIFSFQHLKK